MLGDNKAQQRNPHALRQDDSETTKTTQMQIKQSEDLENEIRVMNRGSLRDSAPTTTHGPGCSSSPNLLCMIRYKRIRSLLRRR